MPSLYKGPPGEYLPSSPLVDASRDLYLLIAKSPQLNNPAHLAQHVTTVCLRPRQRLYAADTTRPISGPLPHPDDYLSCRVQHFEPLARLSVTQVVIGNAAWGHSIHLERSRRHPEYFSGRVVPQGDPNNAQMMLDDYNRPAPLHLHQAEVEFRRLGHRMPFEKDGGNTRRELAELHDRAAARHTRDTCSIGGSTPPNILLEKQLIIPPKAGTRRPPQPQCLRNTSIIRAIMQTAAPGNATEQMLVTFHGTDYFAGVPSIERRVLEPLAQSPLPGRRRIRESVRLAPSVALVQAIHRSLQQQGT